MEKINRILRDVCMALTAALMAGCAVYAVLRAVGLSLSWPAVYASAVALAALMQFAGKRKTALWVIALAAICGGAVLAFANSGALSAAIAAKGEVGADLSAYTRQANAMACGFSLICTALFLLMLKTSATIPVALTLEIGAIVCAMAMNPSLSLWIVTPGVAAGVLAFALPAEVRGEMRPILAVPAVLLALLALIFVPAQNTTWTPLENLAERVRSIVEDYVRFTEERVAFSINELGYDHAGMLDDQVVAMLGGKANPVDDTFMRVIADRDVLLRGTIKRSYTGYSWVDDQAKARYLYYDFTHASVRDKVFDADRETGEGVFLSVNAEVEMLAEGTSTLFVPAQMQDFSMNLASAVYYNSTGEVFLTRSVQVGDRYSLTARVPGSREALVQYAQALEDEADERYNDAMLNYTHLPDGVDSAVYALAVELTKDSACAAEKAYAIEDYLSANYSYTLDGSYPPAGEDFVSWFLLDSKEGYCSYFASAMTVMCRIAGVPARYVEGYYVHPVDGEAIVTGRNAHAWVEVYLNGIGWVAFDPTAAAVGAGAADSSDEHVPNEDSGLDSESGQKSAPDPAQEGENEFDVEPSPTPNAGDRLNENTQSDLDNDGESEPTPTPPAQNPSDDAMPPPDPQGDAPDREDEPVDEPQTVSKHKAAWLWILLGSLLLLALLTLYIKKRLIQTDPLNMIRGKKSLLSAALILYRANLNLLARMGLAPGNGETPDAFAARVTAAIPNADYAEFVSAVAVSRYSGRPLTKQSVDAGARAYASFLQGMSRMERLKYHLGRLLRGFGDTENIP